MSASSDDGTRGRLVVGILIALGETRPSVAEDCYVAPTAVLIGDVVIESGASVWFGAVLRGDYNRIVVGTGSNIQDNAVLHTEEDRPTLIGRNVTVGHLALLHACVIEEGALIGMGSIVLSGARIGHHAMLAAGSVVKEGAEIPPGVLAAGAPAEVKKRLDGKAADWVEMGARDYQALRLRYLQSARMLHGASRVEAV